MPLTNLSVIESIHIKFVIIVVTYLYSFRHFVYLLLACMWYLSVCTQLCIIARPVLATLMYFISLLFLHAPLNCGEFDVTIH